VEIDLVGFNLYRSTALSTTPLEGEYQRLNETLIPSQAPGGMQGASYEFSVPAAPGETCYYWLEAVMVGAGGEYADPVWFGPLQVTGNRLLFLPVIRR
jgi:hypothetical protein